MDYADRLCLPPTSAKAFVRVITEMDAGYLADAAEQAAERRHAAEAGRGRR